MLYFSHANLAPGHYGWLYSDFEKKAVSIRGNEEMVTVELVPVKNTQKDWQKITSSNTDCMCRIYTVDLSDADVSDSYIENLQYFFIRADRVSSPAQNAPQLGLLVQGNADNVYRARIYLSLLGGDNARYNLLYRVSDKSSKSYSDYCSPIHNPTNELEKANVLPGRFMPLLHIVSPSPSYTTVPTLYSGDITLSDLCSTEEWGYASSGVKLTTQELVECYETYPKSIDIPWRDSVQKLCLLYWHRALNNITGTKENKMNAKEKADLRDQLTKYVLKKRKHMSLLAELCWFFNLHIMMLDKLLLRQADTQTVLDEPVLLQSYLDSLNYTDGIMQLLENSCQHTRRQACYMTVRMLLVKRDTTDRQLLANMRTRETLINRYKTLSGLTVELDLRANYYVDISIVDDARISANRLMGLLRVYRENVRRRYKLPEEKLPQTLEDVFSDERALIDTPAQLVHHYGLDSLKQVISKNGGLFLISSPYTEKDPDSKTTEVVLYPFHPKNKPLPHDNLDETTEYHILYPLRNPCIQSTETAESGAPHKVAQQYPFESGDLKNWDIKTRKYSIYSFFPKDSQLLYLNQAQKIERIQQAFSLFQEQLYQETPEHIVTDTDLENRIFLFDIRGISSLQLELFAKFLFQLIVDKTRNGMRRLFAVYFDNSLDQQEFIRLFAIFYRRVRQLEDRKPFLGVQIALCSTYTSSAHPIHQLPEVNLILNAKNWNSLFESARQFAYCNLESAQKVFSQIRYFADCDKKDAEIIDGDSSLFPFDLYLKDSMDIPQESASPITVADVSQCWFMQRIAYYMQMDLQQDRFGIMLSDSHFYLRSNIHLESFYQAELLFHNISYVWRFAYLLAKRILESGYPFKNYFLVCYEAYSSLLVQYIAAYLKTTDPQAEVEYAIMYQTKPDEAELLMPELQNRGNFADSYNNWGFTCLYPVGTTLSTLHTMHECIEKECGIVVSSSNTKDIVLILVSPAEESVEIQKRYLEVNTQPNMSPLQQARVQLLSRYGNERWDVDYFLFARTPWHEPLKCGETDRGRPLVHTDVTSTQLNMIFPPKTADDSIISRRKADPNAYWNHIHQHDVCSMLGFDKNNDNDARLRLLKTCVHYGHISRDSNHYSFYVNFPRYFEILKTADKAGHYQKWLDDLQGKAVDPNAFNIIVTPLRSDRSPLLMDLTRFVFSHSTHILQLDLHNVRRTDIRTKYRFIADECAELLHNDPMARINVYYVDSSIVTSESLHRGLSLIQMLLRDRIPMEKEIHLYQGIFVLLNRSSKDTIQPFVENPLTDYHAFAHLAIPHYNTRSGICPSCKRVEKYEMLSWRSATNEFVAEYQRLIDKDKVRTCAEFERWQKEQLMKSPGAFLRFRQWVYHYSDMSVSEECNADLPYLPNAEVMSQVNNYLQLLQQRFYKQFCEDFDIPDQNLVPLLRGTLRHPNPQLPTDVLRQYFLTKLDNLSLDALVTPEERDGMTVKSLEQVWMNCVIGEQAYRRLICAHHAYGHIPLEAESGNPDKSHTTAIHEIKQIIVEYLEAEMNPPKAAYSIVERWEYLHSCLKVLSRDNLSRYRTVREAVYDLLHDAADIMLGINQSNSMLRKLFSVEGPSVGVPALNNRRCTNITPLLRYQMFVCILRRLSDMQSNYPVIRLSDNKIRAQLDNLLSLFFDSATRTPDSLDALFCCPVPSMQRMLFSYEKCIKLTTMAGDEKNKSMLILQKYEYTP